MDTYHLLLVALAITRHCEALIFTSKPNATTTVCSGENVTFNWIYTSGAPTGIAWTKRNNDAIKSLNASVATFSIGSFIPDAAFATRVAQVGTNAAIQLSGVTPADDGIYQVEITDPPSIFKEDTTLTVFGSPVGNLRASYLGKTSPVKCEGLSSLGSGSLTLVLDGNTIQSTQLLSLEDTSGRGGRYCCCVIMSVDAAKCLPAGDNSTDCSAHCVDLAATTTAPSQPTETTFPTSPPTATRNNTNGADTNTSSPSTATSPSPTTSPSATSLSTTTSPVSTTETSQKNTTLSIVAITFIVVFITVGIFIVAIIFVCVRGRKKN